VTAPNPSFDSRYALDDKYTRESGRIYITGVQALVRLPLMQRLRDRAAGLNTAGFISGYRGSPLGTYDLALWDARKFLEDNQVLFQPGVNEDLAATAVWGTQLLANLGPAKVDGVFGIWYGKGPGVDRSCDALKHGNYAGTAKHGGVLALCGDDPGAKSSSIAHQSEQALVHMGMPILNPSSVQDYLDFGLLGWGMSRYSSCWVGFKCLTDTVESASSAIVGPDRARVVIPTDFEMPDTARQGLPVMTEEALYHFRLPAAQAFARANGIDRVVVDSPRRRLGIVTTGKAYLDVREALEALGLSEARMAEQGLCIYKVGMSWPLEPVGLRRFAEGLDQILVVEEKRGLVEEQVAALLYNLPRRPQLAGKRDAAGAPLVPDTGELSPGAVEQALRRWLYAVAPALATEMRPMPPAPLAVAATALARTPSFCSGCPHNSSTVLPDGSLAGGGIGCHGMSAWMPARRTVLFTHMGGEGANWVGVAPFTHTPHIFQNMGDGTYFHSGLLAIRANVAAKTNITYKILVNGAVAMTGGQPIEGGSIHGEITTPEVAQQLRAEGVQRIAVASNEPEKYAAGVFPEGTTIHHRDELIALQKELRTVPGVSALVYDQTCAAEARRLRKRGEFPEPDRRVLINELVCEGCGDCGAQSNCISIEPVETEFGRKRRINQSSCNKDYSCLKGYCPSFVTVVGGRVRVAEKQSADVGGDEIFRALPEPSLASCEEPFNILVTGIGGTGVVTVGALLGMAAHLEGRGCSVLDVTGLSQKNGPVTSHVRIASRGEDIHATRIANACADLVIGCDIIVTAGREPLAKIGAGRTTPVINAHVTPTSDFAGNPDLDLSSEGMQRAIRDASGGAACDFLDASELAAALLGDAIFTNPFLMGFAYQRGRLPVSQAALFRAIELNGRAIAENQRAFVWGRLAAHDLAAVKRAAAPGLRGEPRSEVVEETLDAMTARRGAFLTDYQDAAYAKRYRDLVERVASRESAQGLPGDALARAVARYGFKLMAYKDEYEVARLWTGPEFRRQLDAEFEGDYQLQLQLAPPHLPVLDWILKRRDPETGRTKKMFMPSWFFSVLGLMARFKFLRGTPFDPFGRTAERRMERALIEEYGKTIDELLDGLTSENRDLAVQIASVPELIRGFDLVKERHLEQARAKQAELLQTFRLRAPATSVREL
jgi:indolepyruvate ferredoxin oxidoreductase